MTQIIVNLNDEAKTSQVRRAIEMLQGVVSTSVFPIQSEKTRVQRKYVQESLGRALRQTRDAKYGVRPLQTLESFMSEL
ncbi:MAG: hypothetical protein IJS89_03080 [Bacteroidaceae bacterium]|nr:hypothetical protein [Bacteroidaceae bacterium]